MATQWRNMDIRVAFCHGYYKLMCFTLWFFFWSIGERIFDTWNSRPTNLVRDEIDIRSYSHLEWWINSRVPNKLTLWFSRSSTSMRCIWQARSRESCSFESKTMIKAIRPGDKFYLVAFYIALVEGSHPESKECRQVVPSWLESLEPSISKRV